MATLTRKQKAVIESALRNAERAQATTTFHYTRADGATLYEVAKDIGSDLVGLQFCIKDLRRLLIGVAAEAA